MKAKLSAGLSALQGKLGAYCGKVINGRQQIGRLSIPYGKSGEAPSAAQVSVQDRYAQKVEKWRTATPEQRAAWDLAAEPLNISGFNFMMMVSEMNQTDINQDETEATTLDSPIASLQGNMNRIRHWVIALSGEAWGTVTTSTAALAAKFHATTGHTHTGGASDAPTLDHGLLTGLADDDHTQYAKVDGSRAFTGDQSMGANKVTAVMDPTAAQDAATKKYVDDKFPAWATWDPTLTWSTATPAAITKTCRYCRYGNTVFFTVYITSADSNAASNLTFPLPVSMGASATLTPLTSIETYGAAGTTYKDPIAYADNATSVVRFRAFSAGTDAKTITILIWGSYEV